ncbi:hypothetical protein LCGC14_2239230 [marine sediment metagenome]|uniref:Uncharacterized protein n=1 Tax=marine sediment metagenome TaxID=412755 RepID=A0A0F9D641_9ZZZZ
MTNHNKWQCLVCGRKIGYHYSGAAVNHMFMHVRRGECVSEFIRSKESVFESRYAFYLAGGGRRIA